MKPIHLINGQDYKTTTHVSAYINLNFVAAVLVRGDSPKTLYIKLAGYNDADSLAFVYPNLPARNVALNELLDALYASDDTGDLYKDSEVEEGEPDGEAGNT